MSEYRPSSPEFGNETSPELSGEFGDFSLFGLLDTVDIGLLAADLSGNPVHINVAAEEKFGLEGVARGDQLLRHLAECYELVEPDGSVLAFEDWPLSRALRGEMVRNLELRLRRTDRAWSRFHRYSTALLRDTAGDPRLVLLTIKDLSDRDRLEQQLHYRLEELETLMDVAPVALFVSDDPQCDHMVGNRTANAYYQARAGDNLSASPAHESDPERRFYIGGREATAAELPMQVAASENRMVRNVEVEVSLPGGRRLDMLGSATPLHDARGQVRGCVGAFLDVSEHKQAEKDLKEALALAEQQRVELEASHRELKSFSYSVSHDLQGPLRAINGFSQALLEDCDAELDEVCRNYLSRIRSGTLRMQALIDGLLRLTRVSHTELQFGPVDLSSLAREVMDELTASEPDRQVEVAIEPGLTAWGDLNALRLLVQNLLSNAWKFSAGRPVARLAFGRAELPGKTAVFVRDNGIGFEPKYAQQLFRPFERLHSDEEFQGSGIGLATVQRIIHRHGGEVWAEGVPDGGATFFFTLEPDT